jgi:hypothetical protein
VATAFASFDSVQVFPKGWDFLHVAASPTPLPIEHATEKNTKRLMNAIGLVPLRQFYSNETQNHVLATPDYAHDPLFGLPVDISRFDFQRVEGSCLKTRQDGTIPLHFYFNATSGDSALATKNIGADLTYMGKVRTECYIWKRKGKNRLALEVYFNSERGDHLTLATAEAKVWAIDNGYQKLGRTGFVASSFGVPAQVKDIGRDIQCNNESAPVRLENSPEKDLLMTLDSLLQKLIQTKGD